MVSMKFFNDIPMQKTNYYKWSLAWFPLQAVFVGRFYDGVIQKKLRRFKFVHNTVDTVYFETIFRELIAESGIKNTPNTLIVYPPISLKDRIFRWPNHAKKLAKIFATILWTQAVMCPFHKNFFAGHQSRRTKLERKQIFSEYHLKREIPYPLLQNKEIIIIDDIITTGYTAYSLGRLLQPLWVKWILWFFLASQKM